MALGPNLALSSVASAIGGVSRPRAALALDFLTPSNFDPRITFTRADATSCATYFDSTGRLQTAAANVARFDYDPATPAGVTGGELYPGFAGASSVGAGWVVSGGQASHSGGSSTISDASNYAAYVAGKTYLVTVVCTQNSAAFSVYLRGNSTSIAGQVSTGTFTAYIVAGTSTSEGLTVLSTGTNSFASVSVKEVTFTPRGLLIEESRTNLLLQSRDMTQAAWSLTGSTTAALNAVGLDGAANSCSTVTASATAHARGQVVSVTASTSYVFSFYAKRGTMTDMKYSVYNITGAADIIPATSYYSQTNSSTFSRITVAFTTPVGCTSVQLYLLRDSGVTGTVIFDAAQLEAGAFATSIITTGASTVTRAADSASMTGTNFSSWFNAGGVGTLLVEADYTNGRRSFVFSNGTTNEMLIGQATSATTIAGIQRSGGIQTGFTSNAVSSVSSVNKIAVSYSSTDINVSANGGTVQNSVGALVSSGWNQLYIGSQNAAPTSELCGHIRRLTYYPTRLPNATLQALTS